MSETAGPADILVVEDEPVSRTLLTGLLEREGYTLAVAEQGGQALTYLRSHPRPRLILLDLVMPYVDGWAFLRERQRLPALSAVPVVVFSSVGGLEGPDPLRLGAAEILLKPFDVVKVLDVARRYCRVGAGGDV
jgi:CheY-like chemotaxis protein